MQWAPEDKLGHLTVPLVGRLDWIDGTLLAANADYVLEIRTYKGHVMAPRGDFAPIDYPYGAAIVFTRTFRTS